MNWIEQREELEIMGGEAWEYHRGLSYFEQVADHIRVICSFLEIPRVSLDGYQVQTSSNLEFLRWLSEDSRFTTRDLEYIRLHLKKAKNLYIPHAGIIYLPVLSVNYAAEEATHYIIHICRGIELSPESDLYLDILDKALGYFGSKVINHKRFCKKDDDFRTLLAKLESFETPNDEQQHDLRVLSKILEHIAAENEYAEKGRLPELPDGWLDDLALRIDLVRALGYRLGDRLFEAVITGGTQPLICKANLRSLICTPFDDPLEPQRTYFDLVYRMYPLKGARRSKRDYL